MSRQVAGLAVVVGVILLVVVPTRAGEAERVYLPVVQGEGGGAVPTATVTPSGTPTLAATTTVPTMTATPDAYPEIVNGSFEEGEDGWETNLDCGSRLVEHASEMVDGARPRDGEYVAMLGGCNDATEITFQVVDVTGLDDGDPLYLHVWFMVRSTNPTCEGGHFSGEWFGIDAGTSPESSRYALLLCQATSGGWQEVVLDYSYLANYRDVHNFDFTAYLDDSYISRVYIDEVYLSREP